ncbi:integration host factor subunit beta [Dyella sp.]|uniref:integration host factor subunit beta n=1 Tax=Dyella sp. TaxID=1869338 RepID=UPI002D7675E8|nr:integration host factor subunit beta [Dyella sp.]HET7332750.1 integration host factor subunit beta [Dyella sp.]
MRKSCKTPWPNIRPRPVVRPRLVRCSRSSSTRPIDKCLHRGGVAPPRFVPRHGHWGPMTKSELIEALARRQTHLAFSDVELAVKNVIEQMSQALAGGERIEIRGFGSFALHYRPPRMGRNPKTGEAVALPGKHVPHFKPGKELRERVNMRLEQQNG